MQVAGVGVAAAAAAATASSAWKYNRANYLWDSTLRFNRYVTGYQFAIAQAQQYRDDIRDFTELTVSKQETYTIIGTVFMILNFMLMLSGRLGIFGPAPPGWMMGIYWGNATTALCFLLTLIWLSVHATGRAMAGGANMLTRRVRLPVPTPKQLDKARKTGVSFEQQRVTDTFRIPFLAPAPKAPAQVVDVEMGGMAPKSAANRRMPKWYQDEKLELDGVTTGAAPGHFSTPEHFELYRGLQEEWWCHEAYVRVGLLFFMSHWLTAANLYTQCHCFTELRALWPAWSITPLFCTANWIILQMDIIPNSHTRLEKLRWERYHPWMPFVTCFAMSWEYSSVPAGGGWRALIYVLAWICYCSQFLFVIKLYDLAEPAEQAEHPDVPGRAWWPQEWRVPPAFNGSLYLVAAPNYLESGVPTCLQEEMKAAKGPKGATAPLIKQRRVSPQEFPWKIFRGSIFTAIAVWIFIICGRIWEECHGERRLLKQEGREIRWPATMQGWVSPWTRSGKRDEMAHAGGSDRRLVELSDEVPEEPEDDLAAVAQQLMSELSPLADTLLEKQRLVPRAGVSASSFAVLLANSAWPAGFMPSFLASKESKGETLVAAIAKNRRGTVLHLKPEGTITTVFDMSGIDHLGDLLGASWGPSGLIVGTSSGSIAECRGRPSAGLWRCRQVGPALPTSGAFISAARVPGTTVTRAAVTFADEAVVALFEAAADGSDWFPVGEVQLPQGSHEALHLSFSKSADELLISLHDGSSMKWRLTDAEPKLVFAPHSSGAVWHAACSLADGREARLATPSGSAGPNLLLSSRS